MYRFALGKDGAPPVTVDAPTYIGAPTLLRGAYVDRRAARAAGAAIGIGGSLVGVAMALGAVHTREDCDAFGDCVWRTTTDAPLMTAGIGVIVGSIVVGAALGTQGDEAHLTVEPLAAARVEHAVPTVSNSAALTGAALTVRF